MPSGLPGCAVASSAGPGAAGDGAGLRDALWKRAVVISFCGEVSLPVFRLQGSRGASCGWLRGGASLARAGAGPLPQVFPSNPTRFVCLNKPVLLQQKANGPQAAASHSSSGNMSFEGRSELKTLSLLSLTGFPCLTAVLWPLCSQSPRSRRRRAAPWRAAAAEDRRSRGGLGRGRRFAKHPHCCPHWVPRSHGCQFGGWDLPAPARTRWLSGWRARLAFPGQSWVCRGCFVRATFASEGPRLNRAPLQLAACQHGLGV